VAATSTQTITDVSSTNVAPISGKRDISLSTDGGQTFRRLSGFNTNDGSETITVEYRYDTSRIKIEAVENIFFDITT
jgi:hypothetical protein